MSTDQDLAQRSADAMWEADAASQGLGMKILEIGPGTAKLAMTITKDMLNGHGTAHGGYIYTLADSAFAFACNSYNERAVGAHCSISYVQPAQGGKTLIASAKEVSRAGRSGIYDVEISQNDKIIAHFRGHSRLIGGSIF